MTTNTRGRRGRRVRTGSIRPTDSTKAGAGRGARRSDAPSGRSGENAPSFMADLDFPASAEDLPERGVAAVDAELDRADGGPADRRGFRQRSPVDFGQQQGV